jgi:hypothetical protein
MISHRQADLLEQLKPKDLFIGIDENEEDAVLKKDGDPSSLPGRFLGLQCSVENYYGVPAVFFASTVPDELAEQINNEFKSFPPTLIGAQVTGNNAEFEEYIPVDIRKISKNVGMENIKAAAEKILEKLGQTILKTEIHEPSHEYDSAYVYFQLK